ncbi:MAG TPA: glycosyltransferase [Solirubrobacteraceae bacterium]|jgi:glycosyltransferase involved in cell wall biosynthesis|nr:glycosyltransferase [Solirubrobacteraceae bacterium]
MESAKTTLRAPSSVSACLVVRNEEAVIERCLQSLAGVVEEIVLVHDGVCEDRTLEIASRYGCRVFVRPLVGHAEASTVFAFEQARGEWIMSLDADEYLSDALRGQLRELVDDVDVNGYELLWRMWDGQRYITENGPYKLALFKRSSVHLLGTIHGVEIVDPPIRRVDLQLEHRPRYNNFALHTMLTKWRCWARINAHEFLMPFDDLPRFNWEGSSDWPPRRRILNRLSPLLFLPYVPVVLVVNLWRERGVYGLRENLRMSLYQGLYGGMVQFYVAKYKYLGGARPAVADPPIRAPGVSGDSG